MKDDELLAAIESNFRTAPLGNKRRAMVTYVEKLTQTPGDMTEQDVRALRDVNFSDRDILEICEVASYYAYVNRIADGLGVEVESHYENDNC